MKRLTTILLTMFVPAMLAAQQHDTTHKATPRGRHVATSGGSVARARRMRTNSMGLTTAQVAQLQAALQREECKPGPVDGVMGARTRSGLACARQKLGVTGDDTNALLKALGLNFTVGLSHGMGTINRSGRTPNDSAGGKAAPPTMRTRGDSSQLNPREKATRPPGRL